MQPTPDQRFARVKELFERERAHPTVARTLDDIPLSYELISDEWLTAVLCGNIPGAAVASHTLDVADEGTSNRRRIFLHYNARGAEAGLPPSVFCKATQSLECRFILGLNNCAQGEITFHNKVRPLLDIEAPVSFFSKIDRESLNSISVLRDMGSEVTFCDENTPMSLERARSQMDLLARLHGRFLASPELDTILQDYLTFEELADMTEEAIQWSDAAYQGLLAAESVVPEAVLRRAKEVWGLTHRAFRRHGELPRTLIHNDVHLRNWYITADGTMGLNDWQCGVRGHWSRDLAYAMSTALTPENRRAWERELIRYYLDRLEEQGVTGTSFDEAMTLYRQQLFAALLMWTATLVPAVGAPQMQPPATSLAFIRRIACAIDDLEAFDSFGS